MQKTKREIRDETIAHYDHPEKFGMSMGDCVYLNESSGAMCAVGRCLIDPASAPECSVESWAAGLSTSEIGFNDALKPEYRGHSAEFWQLLQQMHDDCSFVGKPLTEFVEAMRTKAKGIIGCSEARIAWKAILDMIEEEEASA